MRGRFAILGLLAALLLAPAGAAQAQSGLNFIYEVENWKYEADLQWLYAIEAGGGSYWYYSHTFGWMWHHEDFGNWIFTWAFVDGMYSLKKELRQALHGEPIARAADQPDPATDPVTIVASAVRERELLLSVEYPGGNWDSRFALFAGDSVQGGTTPVWLVRNGFGDPGQETVRRTLRFDLASMDEAWNRSEHREVTLRAADLEIPYADSTYLRFDGAGDRVSLGNLDVEGSALTLEAWVRASDLTNCPQGDCRVISKASGTSTEDHYWMLSTREREGEFRLRFRVKTGGTTHTLESDPGAAIAENQWNHLAGVYDGTQMHVYINGALAGSTPATGPITPGAGVPVWIGDNPDETGSRPWSGDIDAVRIWSSARTAEQIAAGIKGPIHGPETGKIAEYRMDEGSGATVYDASGRGNHGQLGSTDGADSEDPDWILNRYGPFAAMEIGVVNVTHDSAEIIWRTNAPATAEVNYTTEDTTFRVWGNVATDGARANRKNELYPNRLPSSSEVVDEGSTLHRIVLTDLESGPDIEHFFQVRSTAADGRIALGPVLRFETKEPPVGPMASEITRHGITWTFDDEYRVGQFANGDYWVVGPVTINAISPDYTGERHGWGPNPDINEIPYDAWLRSFDSSLVPSLPYEAVPGESIVKAVSVEDPPMSGNFCHEQAQCLDSAAVLTVVDEVPPGEGRAVFRPPYVGDDKPYYFVEDLRLDLLANVTQTASAPEHLAEVERWFERLWVHHRTGWSTRNKHPRMSMPGYHAGMSRRTGKGALALHLNYPRQDKTQAVINYVQIGIDMFHMFEMGRTWTGAATQGAVTPIVYAALLLDDDHMKNAVDTADPGIWGEGGDRVYRSERTGMALFGSPSTPRAYWENQTRGGGSRTARDPHGYIDGGEVPGAVYQTCCFSQTFRGAAIALRFIEGQSIFNHEPFFEYTDRWMDFGAWTVPDPCAPPHPTLGMAVYGQAFGPDGSEDGDCIRGAGRGYEDRHGTMAGRGDWDHPFLGEMFTEYRLYFGPLDYFLPDPDDVVD